MTLLSWYNECYMSKLLSYYLYTYHNTRSRVITSMNTEIERSRFDGTDLNLV